MGRALPLLIVVMILGACTQRLVCPAYQSSFIYDKEAVRKKFSYFKEDSTPKVYTASKSKYLIAVPESYRKKYRRMQTVEMTPVYPVIPDSIKQQQEFQLAEADPLDSLGRKPGDQPDSIYAITKTKEKYNLDQDLYMWYFRELLVLPDVRAAMEKKNEEKGGPATAAAEKKEKKGMAGFFKNLFKKKPKNDSAAVAPPVTDVNGPQPPKEKKGGLFKKKTKEKETQPKKKEDGDGF